MKYKNVVAGIFKNRPNRFVAEVEIDGKTQMVHVKNTGRCKEILTEGTTVYLASSDNKNRKTEFDLIAAVKKRENLPSILINLDSQIPNCATEEYLKKGELFSPFATIKREVRYGKSRFDFYIEDGERKIFLEVKGVTQESCGKTLFPDAPTERGIKHIEELISCQKDGFEAYILFVIQMKGADNFSPNYEIHKAFGEALKKAAKSGVRILAKDCIVTPDSIVIDSDVPVIL